MKGLEDLVKKAVGYDEARNDQVSVSNVPFAAELGAAEELPWYGRWLQVARGYQKALMNAVLMILMFFFVVRPLIRKLQQIAKQLPAVPQLEAGGMSMAQLPHERLEISADSLPALRERAVTMIRHDPDKARDVLRAWLRET
jgi:flagellar M-ring protein FliF